AVFHGRLSVPVGERATKRFACHNGAIFSVPIRSPAHALLVPAFRFPDGHLSTGAAVAIPGAHRTFRHLAVRPSRSSGTNCVLSGNTRRAPQGNRNGQRNR